MKKPATGNFTKFAPISATKLVADLKPQNYILQDILIQGYCYFLTARNNHGKTTLAMKMASSISKGENFGSLQTLQGNVLLLSGENTLDTAYKIKALQQKNLVDVDKVDVITTSFNIVEDIDNLLFINKTSGKEYRLVIVDSLQAYACGTDQNGNKEALENTTACRRLTSLKGNPTVVILAHPVKNATEDNLVPYGGGSAVNEVDGNLTLWLNDGIGKFSHTKLRQPSFQVVNLELEVVELPEIGKNNFGVSTASTIFNVIETDNAIAKAAENYHRRENLLKQLLTCEMPAHKLADILIGNTDDSSVRKIERDVQYWRKKEYLTPHGIPKLTAIGKKHAKES